VVSLTDAYRLSLTNRLGAAGYSGSFLGFGVDKIKKMRGVFYFFLLFFCFYLRFAIDNADNI